MKAYSAEMASDAKLPVRAIIFALSAGTAGWQGYVSGNALTAGAGIFADTLAETGINRRCPILRKVNTSCWRSRALRQRSASRLYYSFRHRLDWQCLDINRFAVEGMGDLLDARLLAFTLSALI